MPTIHKICTTKERMNIKHALGAEVPVTEE